MTSFLLTPNPRTDAAPERNEKLKERGNSVMSLQVCVWIVWISLSLIFAFFLVYPCNKVGVYCPSFISPSVQAMSLCYLLRFWTFCKQSFFPSFQDSAAKARGRNNAQRKGRQRKEVSKSTWSVLSSFYLFCFCWLLFGCMLHAGCVGGGGEGAGAYSRRKLLFLIICAFFPICLAVWFDVACLFLFFSLESVIIWNFRSYKWNFYVHRQHICTDWKKISCTRHVLCW